MNNKNAMINKNSSKSVGIDINWYKKEIYDSGSVHKRFSNFLMTLGNQPFYPTLFSPSLAAI